MELSITYNYIHIGQTCRLHTTTLRSDMSIVYKKSQRTSNNRISCHHIVNLYYPREVCCILPSHDVVTFSCILLSYYCHWTILIVTLLSHYILTLCLFSTVICFTYIVPYLTYSCYTYTVAYSIVECHTYIVPHSTVTSYNYTVPYSTVTWCTYIVLYSIVTCHTYIVL